MSIYKFFFFSSRRRHTRFDCDWSSDVCSSDLFDRRDPLHGEPGRRSVARRVRLARSEEHTSELQSQSNLVCRLLLEKKKGKAPKGIVCFTVCGEVPDHNLHVYGPRDSIPTDRI